MSHTDLREEIRTLTKSLEYHFENGHPDPDITEPCGFRGDVEDEIVAFVESYIAQQVTAARIDSVKHVLSNCKNDPEEGHPMMLSWNKTREYLASLQPPVKTNKENLNSIIANIKPPIKPYQ